MLLHGAATPSAVGKGLTGSFSSCCGAGRSQLPRLSSHLPGEHRNTSAGNPAAQVQSPWPSLGQHHGPGPAELWHAGGPGEPRPCAQPPAVHPSLAPSLGRAGTHVIWLYVFDGVLHTVVHHHHRHAAPRHVPLPHAGDVDVLPGALAVVLSTRKDSESRAPAGQRVCPTDRGSGTFPVLWLRSTGPGQGWECRSLKVRSGH